MNITMAELAVRSLHDQKVACSNSAGSNSDHFEKTFRFLTNDHEPRLGKMRKPFIGPSCRALYYACRAWVKPWFYIFDCVSSHGA